MPLRAKWPRKTIVRRSCTPAPLILCWQSVVLNVPWVDNKRNEQHLVRQNPDMEEFFPRNPHGLHEMHIDGLLINCTSASQRGGVYCRFDNLHLWNLHGLYDLAETLHLGNKNRLPKLPSHGDPPQHHKWHVHNWEELQLQHLGSTKSENCTSQRTCACKLHPPLCETHVPHFSLSAQSGPSAPELPRNLRAQALINPIIARTPQNSRLNAARQHTFGPSWSVRLLAAPRSVGPAVYSGLPPTLTPLWSPLECAAPWPLLAVWDPRFTRAHRQPSPLFGPSWSVRLHGRSSQCGTRGLLGLTANPPHIWSLLECAAPWPLLAVWDPRFTRAYRQPNPSAQNSPKTQKLENSTLHQERAHTRFNEYTLTRPQCIVHT